MNTAQAPKRPLQATENDDSQPPQSRSKRPRLQDLDAAEPAESLRSFVSQWLESVRSARRRRRCQSDGHIHERYREARRRRKAAAPPSPSRARSAPEMAFALDSDGFTVPPRPDSVRTRSRSRSRGRARASTATRSLPSDADDLAYYPPSTPSSAGPRHRQYRDENLSLNGVYIWPSTTPLPAAVSALVDGIRAAKDSPQQDFAHVVAGLDDLAQGCNEDHVVRFLDDAIFSQFRHDAVGLAYTTNALMLQHLVPSVTPIARLKVSQPKPDGLYGYSRGIGSALTNPQRRVLATPQRGVLPFSPITLDGVVFPFLCVDVKASGGTKGDLWVAANQCAGASSVCVNAVEQLNTLSKLAVPSICYSIAVDNNSAHLYVAWRGDDAESFNMKQIDAFLLWSEDHFVALRRRVKAIFDWGMGTRFTQIGQALDAVAGTDYIGGVN